MIESEYQKQYSDTTRMEYSARHILVKEMAAAEEIIKQLNQGADFAQLARDKSTGPSAPYGGELEWFTLENMVPEFSTEIKTLDKNQITTKPVKTRYGWHVIQLLDKREIPPPALEQVRDTLVAELQSSLLEATLEQLRANADIQILKQGIKK
jgi:peptidyl-prolyl cis-trans isomerase C